MKNLIKRSGKEAAKKIKKYDKIRKEKTFREIVDAKQKKKNEKNIAIVEDIKNSAVKKSAKITAKKIFQKYKSMKRPKKTYLVNEEDLETLEYNEPQEDLFWGESILAAVNKVFDLEKFKKEQAEALREMKNEKIDEELFLNESVLAAANKVFDYNKFKKQQKDAIQNFNDKLLDDAETINYEDDFGLDDVKENKNLKISAEKISYKYRKLRKRQAATKIPELQVEDFKLPEKRKRRQAGKAALLAAEKISKKKYKNIRFR